MSKENDKNNHTEYRTFFAEVMVSKDFIEDANVDTSDYIKRMLAEKIVRTLPLEDLEKIFEFSKITGEDQVSQFDSADKKYKIAEMRINETELHIAKIKIPY